MAPGYYILSLIIENSAIYLRGTSGTGLSGFGRRVSTAVNFMEGDVKGVKSSLRSSEVTVCYRVCEI